MPTHISRRTFLHAALVGSVAAVLAACSQPGSQASQPTTAQSPEATALPSAVAPSSEPTQPTSVPSVATAALAPTPACADDDDPTPAQTEGPYFKANSPERASLLEDGIAGERLVVSGMVLTAGCTSVANALLEFWHCDADGNYDNAGFRLRGHQYTDAQGRYELETIFPGVYPGRTRHIHVKVQAPNQPVLTTQLYFPDEPRNATDGIFQPELLVTMVTEQDGSRMAGFDFVLNL